LKLHAEEGVAAACDFHPHKPWPLKCQLVVLRVTLTNAVRATCGKTEVRILLGRSQLTLRRGRAGRSAPAPLGESAHSRTFGKHDIVNKRT
jgi:hypothetical protein